MSIHTRKTTSEAGRQRTRQVAIVAESTCCLPGELIARYGIGILPIPFVFGTETYLDGVDLTRAEFYRKLVETRTPPMTSPPSPGEYLKAWSDAARDAESVVCVTVASKISTLQRSARLASELASEALPDTPVAVVDSLSAGMGQGFVALAAARAAEQGKPWEEVVKIAERVSQRVRMIVTLDTLEYLAKTSHLPQVAAFLGGVLEIKPIIEISNGDIHPIARVRTRHRAVEQLFEQMRRMVPEGARLHVAVQHAQAGEEAAEFEARIRDTFDCVELFTTEFTPVMGGYCGPGLLGVAFYPEEPEDNPVSMPMRDSALALDPALPASRKSDAASNVTSARPSRRPRVAPSQVVDAALCAGAYLYGSLPVVYLLARGRKVDLKHTGSGNVGATNLLTAGGPGLATAGWLFDTSKGLVPLLLSKRLGRSREVAELAGVCGVAGQCWPIFLRFSGGRGISAYVGAGAGIDRVAWAGSLLPMIAGALWHIAPRLRRAPARGGGSRGAHSSHHRKDTVEEIAHAARSKSVPLGCFVSAVAFPVLVGARRGFRPRALVAPTLLSTVLLARRLTASLPDDAINGPAVKPKAWLYRLLYDRNTSD